ncbi:MAG: glycosyltransferase, partial [Candidatus Eremiobacteraeota bacterium]|nr:glycosyltransferase [Candidatus Eremiobacteraeota bacterium]
GIRNVYCVPNLHEIESREQRSFEQTEGLLFIGSYKHTPNVDAVRWLCEEIMPLVWAKLPNVIVTLLGSDPPTKVQMLRSQLVHVPGFVADVRPYFLRGRVFVAPLRFGAGLKGKIGHSLSYGLPVVTTPVGAEGFGLRHGYDCWLAEEHRSFAEGIVSVYTDSALWRRLSENALKAVEPFQSSIVGPQALHVIDQVISNPADAVVSA